jgi:hypothetical protein
MNWYEDQIIEAYKQVMDVEQWPDPRVRIATIGDRGSGECKEQSTRVVVV